jgi:hypothetical protein
MEVVLRQVLFSCSLPPAARIQQVSDGDVLPAISPQLVRGLPQG